MDNLSSCDYCSYKYPQTNLELVHSSQVDDVLELCAECKQLALDEELEICRCGNLINPNSVHGQDGYCSSCD